MEEKKITLTLTAQDASELYDLLHRIYDEYDRLEPFAPKGSMFVKTDEEIYLYHSEMASLDVLLVQLDNQI